MKKCIVFVLLCASGLARAQTQLYTFVASATGGYASPTTPTLPYFIDAVNVRITAVGTSASWTAQIQTSPDNSTWSSCGSLVTATSNASASGGACVPSGASYIRVYITAGSGGGLVNGALMGTCSLCQITFKGSAAGGDLCGTYPNPTLCPATFTTNKITVQGLGFPAMTYSYTGTEGSTRYTYVISATDSAGLTRIISRTLFAGYASLSGSNYNTVTIAAWSNTFPYVLPVGSCNVYVVADATAVATLLGTISNCASGGSFSDTGAGGTTATLPSDTSGYINGQLAIPTSSAPNTMVATGDSITGIGQSVYQGSIYFTDVGWLTQANALLGQRINFLDNEGIIGQGCPAIQARFQADVIAQHPQWVSIECAVNDQAAGNTFTVTWPYIKKMYQQAQAAGIKIVAHTVTASTYNSSGNVAYWSLYNSTIKEYARSQSPTSFVVVDDASVTVDPSSTTAQPCSGCLYDGVHPVPTTALAMATLFYNALNPILPAIPGLPVSYAADPGNIIPSGPNFMVGTGGTVSGTGVTGTLANGWTSGSSGTITCVLSKGTRTDITNGVTQIFTISAGTAGSYVTIRDQITNAPTPGTLMYMQTEILSANTSIALELEFWNSGFTPINPGGTTYSLQYTGNGYETNTIAPGIYRTADIPVPTGTAYIVAYYYIYANGVNSPVVTIGRSEIRAEASF